MAAIKSEINFVFTAGTNTTEYISWNPWEGVRISTVVFTVDPNNFFYSSLLKKCFRLTLGYFSLKALIQQPILNTDSDIIHSPSHNKLYSI